MYILHTETRPSFSPWLDFIAQVLMYVIRDELGELVKVLPLCYTEREAWTVVNRLNLLDTAEQDVLAMLADVRAALGRAT